MGTVADVTRALRTLLVAALGAVTLTVGACSSSGGLSLDPDAAAPTPVGMGADTGTRTEAGTADHVVPAIGYRCADGSMVYSTDTSHGRDGERWSVEYDAVAELEQRC